MKQITEDYVSDEVAVLLKEKGFDVPVKNYFSLNKDAILHNLDKKYGAKKNWNAFDICISRPSQSLALKWLREEKEVFIAMGFCDYPSLHKSEWIPEISTHHSVFPDSVIAYDSYEEAVEAACLWVLKNLL